MTFLSRMVRMAHQYPELRKDILKVVLADFDPEDIVREDAGPLESEADESGYMGGHFTQQIWRELSDRQEGGDLGASPVDAPRAPAPGKQAARLKTLRRLRVLRAKAAAGGCDSPKLPEALRAQCKEKQEEAKGKKDDKEDKKARLQELRRRRAGFNPEDIGREVGGPLESLDGDEAYMGGEFTQQENRELRETEQAGKLPGVTTEPRSPSSGKQARLAHLRRLQELRAQR